MTPGDSGEVAAARVAALGRHLDDPVPDLPLPALYRAIRRRRARRRSRRLLLAVAAVATALAVGYPAPSSPGSPDDRGRNAPPDAAAESPHPPGDLAVDVVVGGPYEGPAAGR